jgi:predicted PurR-regulated permease PerM
VLAAPLSKTEFFQRVLIVAGVAFAGVVLWQTYLVLLLAFAAALLATLLRAITDLIVRRTPLGEAPAYGCALVFALLVIGGAGYLFGAQVAAQVNALAETLPRALHSLEMWARAQPWLGPMLDGFGGGGGAATSIAKTVGNWALNGADALVGVVAILFGAVYFGAQPRLYEKGVALLFPPRQHERVRNALQVSGYALRRWILGQLIDMAAVGTLTGIGLWLIGVPSALALGLLTGLLAFVPYVGAISAGVVATLVAAAQSLELGLWALGIYVAVQQLEGHLILPFVHRWSIALPPALGIFAVIGMGFLFGPLGILLATPLTVVTFVLVKKLYLQETLGEQVSIRP